jgi:alpha-galactosidase
LQKLIHTAVNEWGFSYLKLDFLYMGALRGHPYNAHLTRAQMLRQALQTIRDAAGDNTFLLGCGCPLGPGVGIFDGMRISTDVDPRWHPHYQGHHFFFGTEPGLPATRHAIRNTITRAPMHRRWWLNDPDCLLVRDNNTFLTLAEVTSLASVIALSGGMFLVSDDLTSLSPERRRLIQPLLPVVGESARAVDWMDERIPSKLILPMSNATGEWWVIGLFNWHDQSRALKLALRDFGLDEKRAWHAVDFWNQKYFHVEAGELSFPNTAAHGGVLLAVRAVEENIAQYIGSDLHFTQGFEVKEWRAGSDEVHFRIELGRVVSGWVWLKLPDEPTKVRVEGNAVEATRVGQNLYKIPVEVKREARVFIAMAG